MNALTKNDQAAITPSNAIAKLKEGNERFVSGQALNRDYMLQVSQTAAGQYPFASVVSCIDSRIPTEIIFDQGVGDMFNARVAGNFVNEDILGSLEFACKVAGSKVIVVMGHTSCGAVKGACDHVELGNLTAMLKQIKPALDAISTEDGVDRSSKNISFVNTVAEKNVQLTIERIHADSPVLAEMAEQNEIAIVGAMYDVKSGKVTFLD